MIRVVIFLLFVVALATGLAWLADRPGNLVINWEGREIQTTVFHAIVGLAILIGLAIVAWTLLRGVWQLPAGLGNFFNRRREKRGLDALSSGMIAIGAGDKSLATRYAVQARKSLPNEPLTHILRAQAAQLTGDQATARRIFEAMLSSPDTEPLGLRGLYLEAEKEGETEASRQFAERAMAINPKLAWPVTALFETQCRQGDWEAALQTLSTARKHGQVEKAAADRRRAVLLTAQAQAAEQSDPERAMKLAEEAHTLAPDLVAATSIAGRLLAARGNVKKATKVLQTGWRKGPHPDIATAYAYARIGDSPRDRLARVQQLAALSPHSIESPVAVANAALEAKDADAARAALMPFVDSGRLTQRIATLMARIDGEDGNAGKVREWLARAVHAEPSPVWTADGVVADDWAPISPVTGALDAFQWRVPAESDGGKDLALTTARVEELVRIGANEAVEEAPAGQPSQEDLAAAVAAAGAATAGAAAAVEAASAATAKATGAIQPRAQAAAPASAPAPSTPPPKAAPEVEPAPRPAPALKPAETVEDVEVIEATAQPKPAPAATAPSAPTPERSADPVKPAPEPVAAVKASPSRDAVAKPAASPAKPTGGAVTEARPANGHAKNGTAGHQPVVKTSAADTDTGDGKSAAAVAASAAIAASAKRAKERQS